MSESSQSAEQMAMTSARLAEIAARLSADGIKNLAALLFALAKNPKSHGATSVSKLFSDGSVPQVFQLKSGDLDKFKVAAKEYGVLFSAIKHKGGESDIDILVRMQDTPKINRILEKFGYGSPQWNMGKEDSEKKPESPAQRESPSKVQGNISKEELPLLKFDDIPFPSDSDLPPLPDDFDFATYQFIPPLPDVDIVPPEKENAMFPEALNHNNNAMTWQPERGEQEPEHAEKWKTLAPSQTPHHAPRTEKSPSPKAKMPVKEKVANAKKVADSVNKAVKAAGKEFVKSAEVGK